MFSESGNFAWTFYGILYSALFFGLGLRIQKKKGAVLSGIGLQSIGIIAICIDLYRSLYYRQWIAMPLVAATLLTEVLLILRGQRAQTRSQ